MKTSNLTQGCKYLVPSWRAIVMIVLKRPLYWAAGGPCTNTALAAFTATRARPSPCICNQLHTLVTNKLSKNQMDRWADERKRYDRANSHFLKFCEGAYKRRFFRMSCCLCVPSLNQSTDFHKIFYECSGGHPNTSHSLAVCNCSTSDV